MPITPGSHAQLPEARCLPMRRGVSGAGVEVSTRALRSNGPIVDQLKRAATSIPLNIAEAAGRTGSADAARCYAIARGSAMECAAILDALRVLQALEPEPHRRGTELLERIVAMLTKLCR